jgi:hypothetical protein
MVELFCVLCYISYGSALSSCCCFFGVVLSVPVYIYVMWCLDAGTAFQLLLLLPSVLELENLL